MILRTCHESACRLALFVRNFNTHYREPSTMRTISIPELSFSSWVSWANRNSIPDGNSPGVYLVAVSAEDLAGKAVEWSHVSYIGMSNALGGIKGRLRQFDRAIQGNGGHSGGNKAFDVWKHYSAWADQVFVSAMPVPCNPWRRTPEDLQRMGLVTFLEYEAFSAYLQYCNDALLEQSRPFLNTR